MFKLVRPVSIAASLFTLGACQTTSLSPGAVNKLQAAGYERVANIPSSVGIVTGNAAYLCPITKCGSPRVIVVNSFQGNSNILGQDMETQIRNAKGNATKVQNEFVSGFNSTNEKAKISSTRLYSTPSTAGLFVNGSGRTAQGNLAHFTARVAIRGNAGNVVMGMGQTPAIARSSMNLALED
jgi:hypothetical protein